MKHLRVAKRYATALFKTARATNSLEAVRNDAEFILESIENAKDFKAVLRSPVIQSWKKKNLMFEVFENKISDLSKAFLAILCSKNREDITEEIFEQYYVLYNEQFGLVPVTITSAVALDEAARKSLEESLAKRMNKQPVATYRVDAKIKGGLMVQIGDQLLDSSLRTQLGRMHQSLLKSGTLDNLN